MIVRCSNCGSASTQAMLGDTFTCLTCGANFNAATGEHVPTDGQPEPPAQPEPAPVFESSEWPGPASDDAPAPPPAEPEPEAERDEPVTSGKKSRK